MPSQSAPTRFPMAPCRTSPRMGKVQHCRRSEQRLEEWLFQLLRFAISREAIDKAAALAAAQVLDAAWPGRPSSFTYFSRASGEFCAAIVRARDPQTQLILQRFVARIENRQLKAAFTGCLDLEPPPAPRASSRAPWRTSQDLWRGLPKR